MSRVVGDMDVALSAAVAGAAVVRAAYGSPTPRRAPSTADLTTDADLDAERAIFEVIRRARPEDTRIGEESGRVDGTTSRRWLVDPLCGTRNFAAQTPLFAVNVALVGDPASIACVSADPLAEEYFWTDGRGAHLRCDSADQPLVPSAESRLVDVNCDGPVDKPFLGPQLMADAAFRSAFGTRVTSTTLAVAWVAAGRRAGYVSDGHFDDNVHFAAGTAVCRSAGCVVSDLSGEPLGTGRGLIAAADVETHQRLVDVIRPHLARVPAH